MAVLRAGIFSKCVDANRGTLLKLNHIRDVLAHRDLWTLDQSDTQEFFLGSVYPLVEKFSEEGWIDLASVTGGKGDDLARIAVDHTLDVAARVELRLARHRKIFQARKPVELEEIKKRPLPPQRYGTWFDRTICPACGSDATVIFEVDFDVEDGHAVATGTFVDKLVCHYCDLRMDDYEELERVGVTLDAFTGGRDF